MCFCSSDDSGLPCLVKLLSMPSMDEGWRYTMLVNYTDSELIVDYNGVKYALVPKGDGIIRWNTVCVRDTGVPLSKFTIGDVQLDPVFSNRDLYENKQITIFENVDNAYSCVMTPRRDLKTIDLNFWAGPLTFFWYVVEDLLQTMGELEKKVRIWHNQCKHLLKKYQEAVERVNRAELEFQNFSQGDLEALFMESQDPRKRRFTICLDGLIMSPLILSMHEGEALLRSCGERFYNKAAFALSSLPPCVPTFSKFALAIRYLDWSVDLICCVSEGKPSSLDNWEWCEERCRLVYSDCRNRSDAAQDESLEADICRQNADREALRTSLDLKLSRSPSTSSSKFMNPITSCVRRTKTVNKVGLEAIWRKRLQPSPCAPASFSPLDVFVIDNPGTSFVQVPGSSSRNGTAKSVQRCEWLGETVALSTMSNISKFSAIAETGFLARVQHPNVVEWMGYAYKEDRRDLNCYRECFLVTEHMESDLHDLITERLTGDDGAISISRPPFAFWIAVDIALQIVEAMIHLHKCRVLHRDLKPRNILASRKYSMSRSSGMPFYYTIKLIDFGSSKSGDQGSHFHTRKQGTTIYMAPEVWESEDSYSWSADVYSFGLTCFEIFTGRLPFGSDNMPLTFANIQKVMRGEISFPFDIPGKFKELIEKCWAQNPSDRPSFEDIREALWRLRECQFTDEDMYGGQYQSLDLRYRRQNPARVSRACIDNSEYSENSWATWTTWLIRAAWTI